MAWVPAECRGLHQAPGFMLDRLQGQLTQVVCMSPSGLYRARSCLHCGHTCCTLPCILTLPGGVWGCQSPSCCSISHHSLHVHHRLHSHHRYIYFPTLRAHSPPVIGLTISRTTTVTDQGCRDGRRRRRRTLVDSAPGLTQGRVRQEGRLRPWKSSATGRLGALDSAMTSTTCTSGTHASEVDCIGRHRFRV